MTPLFSRLFSLLDDRLRIHHPAREVAAKVFPAHWSFLLGEVAMFSFVVLVVTGLFLTMFYRPTLDPVVYSGASTLYDGRELPGAYASIVRLSHDVPGGLLVRRVHRAASHAFLLAAIAHLLRIVLTGAFRRPREVNYHVGVLLLLAAVVAGYSGHNLPWDVLSGTSLRILHSFLLSLPWVGESVALWVFGGAFPGDGFATRLFVVHVVVMPAVIIGLVSVHMVILVRQTHTQTPREGVGPDEVHGEPLWPYQAVKSTSLLLGLAGVLVASAVLVPWSDVDLHGPYVVAQAANQSHPDWFLFWVEGALRLYPPIEVELLGATLSGGFVVGVVGPLVVVAAMFAVPWLDRHLEPTPHESAIVQHPVDAPRRFGVVVGFGTWMLLLTAAAGNDVLARLARVSTETVLTGFRVATAVLPILLGWAATRYARRQPPRWNPAHGRKPVGEGFESSVSG